jgi:AcrR family transcriptional regulator
MKRGRSFEKGISGNPRGRPPKSLEERELAAQERKVIADVKAAAKELTQDAIDTLKAAMAAPGAPWAARVAAAGHILDRGWGKPTQPVDANIHWTDSIPLEEKEAMLAVLEAVKAARAGDQKKATLQ